jgi:hypothetical protein
MPISTTAGITKQNMGRPLGTSVTVKARRKVLARERYLRPKAIQRR